MEHRLIVPGLCLALLTGVAHAASRLDSVEILPDQVLVQLSSPARWSRFTLANPPRLVLELSDAQVGGPRFLKGAGRWLAGARISQYSRNPDVVRIALDLTEPVECRVETAGAGITVGIGPLTAAQPAVAPAPAVQTAAPRPLAPADDVAEEAFRFAPGDKGLLAASAALAAWLILRLAVKKAASAARANPAFTPEDTSEMIDGIQQNLNALARRLSILEKQVAQLGSTSAPGPAANGRVEEEIRAMKEVLRSLVKALKIRSDL